MMRRKPIRFFLLIFCLPALVGTLLLVLLLDWRWLGAWILSANLSAFLLWGFDKLQAKRSGWRVPEMALHTMSILGATPAAFIGMRLFRHKTMKMHFQLLYAVLFLVQIATVITLARSGETP